MLGKKSVLSRMATTGHRDHVRSVMPSTTDENDNATSTSPLSTPPLSSHSSPSRASSKEPDLPDLPELPTAPATTLDDEQEDPSELNPIRPYVNPKSQFDFYDQLDNTEEAGSNLEIEGSSPATPEIEVSEGEAQLTSEATGKDATLSVTQKSVSKASSTTKQASGNLKIVHTPSRAQRNGFPKMTDPEVFEEFLREATNKSYEELYSATDMVCDCLASWQEEWDEIDKEIAAYETLQKAEKGRADEDAKEIADRERLLDDEARDKVQYLYKSQLSLKGQEWTAFFEGFVANNPDDHATAQHLTNLHNPQFMANLSKRKRPTKHKELDLINVPLIEPKLSKEEIMIEKKKRGRLMDRIKFDDMKQADVYGFEYSSHSKHIGAQPLGTVENARLAKKKNAKLGDGGDQSGDGDGPEGTRTRVPRSRPKRGYGEIDDGGSPEGDDEGLPAKRARKPKTFEDSFGSNGASRDQSRSGTPAVRTFASGKRVGRPPAAKSKLQVMEAAPSSEELQGSASAYGQHSAVTPFQELAPLQVAQLHDAAESLVNQTVSDKITSPGVKKKHAGGRPKKTDSAAARVADEAVLESEATTKSKNKGGRPRKALPSQPIKLEPATFYGSTHNSEANGVLQSTEQYEGSIGGSSQASGRSRRKRTTVEQEDDVELLDPATQLEEAGKKRKGRVSKKAASSEPGDMVGSPSSKRNYDNYNEELLNPATADGQVKKRKVLTPKIKYAGETIKNANAALTPEEAARKEAIRKEKSRKLSESMKARWAKGGMKAAQETRLANNKLKKAAKEQGGGGLATVDPSPISTPIPIPGQQVLGLQIPPPPPATLLPKPIAPKKPAVKKPKAPLPPRQSSNRVKKPSLKQNLAAGIVGYDGTREESSSSSDNTPVMSEYDHYQALTSPGGVELGKRVRKQKLDLSALLVPDDEEEDEHLQYGVESEGDDDEDDDGEEEEDWEVDDARY